MSCFIRLRLLAIAALICGFASLASAQSDSHGVGVAPIRPAHGISLGVEFGYGADYQQGSFPSSGFFDNGQGNGFTGSIFAEMSINSYFSVGLKAGLDFKNTDQTRLRYDSALVTDLSMESDTVGFFPVNENVTVKISYLTVAPQLYFRPFEKGLFLAFSPTISFLLSSSYLRTRSLPYSITVNGVTYNDLRFTNGTSSEEISNGPITNVSTLRFSGLLSLGYEIDLGNSSIAPIITYDYPFTTVRNTNENNWKIASLYGSVAIKFKL